MNPTSRTLIKASVITIVVGVSAYGVYLLIKDKITSTPKATTKTAAIIPAQKAAETENKLTAGAWVGIIIGILTTLFIIVCVFYAISLFVKGREEKEDGRKRQAIIWSGYKSGKTLKETREIYNNLKKEGKLLTLEEYN